MPKAAGINQKLKLLCLNLVGIKTVLVHGGGPEINDMLRRVGIDSKFINGLRCYK